MNGYSVLTADNGASGLRLLSDNRVDAVILDYKMEGMDGLAVATAIRKRHGKIPIVLLSGYSTLPKLLLETVDVFVAKGRPQEVLLDQLRRVISKRHSQNTPIRRFQSRTTGMKTYARREERTLDGIVRSGS